jgi:hypothetical protein
MICHHGQLRRQCPLCEADADRARLRDLERAAWRVLGLLDEGAITATEPRFIDAAAEAFDSLEAALKTEGSKP